MRSGRPGWLRLALAWSVHALTASGALVGLAALAAVGGGELRAGALWMLAALAIDSVDGTLARALRVAEFVPSLDGRRLDDIVDYLNYAVVPAFFMLAAGSLVHGAWAALPVLASAYGFSQTRAKTDDHFFLGFPSYWNVVAIYLWAFEAPAALGTGIVAGLSIAVFVPVKYVHASRLSVLRRSTNGAGVAWLAAVAAAVALPRTLERLPLLELSLLYPAYYLGLSWWLGTRHGRGAVACSGR